jgi:hypothetical protein
MFPQAKASTGSARGDSVFAMTLWGVRWRGCVAGYGWRICIERASKPQDRDLPAGPKIGA